MIHLILSYYCECCGNVWLDNDNTEYVKCDMCGAKELREDANGEYRSNIQILR